MGLDKSPSMLCRIKCLFVVFGLVDGCIAGEVNHLSVFHLGNFLS